MTLGEEILSYLEDINPKEITSHIEQGTLDQWTKAWKAAAAGAVISALRPVSREQVENVWRGEWVTKHYVDGILEGTNFDECSKCGYQRVFENPELKTKYMFCPACGAAMTDEAVDMVMEKLEGMK